MKRVVLVQLPIPTAGPARVRGNVPLAAGFLELYALRQGLNQHYRFEILSPAKANVLSDAGLVREILGRRADWVGFTCYLWNIERVLNVAAELKRREPGIRIVLGGPEIAADNTWVLEHFLGTPEGASPIFSAKKSGQSPDYAVCGDGERAFAELLANDMGDRLPTCPTETLDVFSSPYLEGILPASRRESISLETVRGCTYGCKYCGYAKQHRTLQFLSNRQIASHLRFARRHGVKEIFLLDPSINQRPDFEDFLRLLARENPHGDFTISGELRAEGINPRLAKLLKAAHFTELEIGLQSVDQGTLRRIGRPTRLREWAEGVRAIMGEGIRVRLDLIVGLPGDTADSVHRGIEFLTRFRPAAEVQIFNLSLLPGTALRQRAGELGLLAQERPPYYVYQTPTLTTEQIFNLTAEAEAALGVEFDEPPPPRKEWFAKKHSDSQNPGTSPISHWKINCDNQPPKLPPAERRAHCFALHVQSRDFSRHEAAVIRLARQTVEENPHGALQVLLEPLGPPQCLRPSLLERLLAACYASTNYLDRFYSLQPGRHYGAKRIFIVLPARKGKGDSPGQSPSGRRLLRAWGEYAEVLSRE
jgi:radical SAM superfamily enzyme YgiQ (UPF0313 family)